MHCLHILKQRPTVQERLFIGGGDGDETAAVRSAVGLGVHPGTWVVRKQVAGAGKRVAGPPGAALHRPVRCNMFREASLHSISLKSSVLRESAISLVKSDNNYNPTLNFL